jgi:8-amino-7-oxononanoate synthase
VLDFTSALYLGFEHPSRSLPEWEQLSLGKPAALETLPGAAAVERDLAALVGCERALLAPSTLHLFWDLFTILGGRGVNIFLDEGAYPVAHWGAERAAACGAQVRVFRQHDVRSLRAALDSTERRTPVVIADGYCPGCGVPAPLAEYLRCTAPLGGLVVIDDTQASGIFGRSTSVWAPYGKEGGGSLQRAGIRDHRVVVVSSLAKAFGAPVAMLAASASIVGEFERRSATRMHCSPPSAAVIAAAAHALALNRRCGDELRKNLARRVARLREGLRRLGLLASDGLFPVQPLRLPEQTEPDRAYEKLLNFGVRAVLHNAGDSGAHQISLVVTARHSLSDIDHALTCLGSLAPREMRDKFTGGKDYGESTEFTGEPLQSAFGAPR